MIILYGIGNILLFAPLSFASSRLCDSGEILILRSDARTEAGHDKDQETDLAEKGLNAGAWKMIKRVFNSWLHIPR